MPTPEILGRNGTYLVFRKLHTRVAAYRQYLHAKAASREEEALLGAKMVGRWQSGAPLALSPEQDDADLGADRGRNNRFGYSNDLRGFRCPAGAHARRANPRDALDHEMSVDVRLHRMLRLGTSYGPTLPEGVFEDDGADRGIIFVFVGAHPKRQFEFVKTQWLNDGIFIGAPAEKDPLAGANDGTGTFTIPQRPIRRRLQSLPPFVITRGGEYCFSRACGRCAGWRSWTPRTAEQKGRRTWQRAQHAPTAGRHSISGRRRRMPRNPTRPCSSSTCRTRGWRSSR